MYGMSPADILTEAPHLMEKMSSNLSLAAVLSIEKAHRTQVHDFVTHITIHDAEHTKLLFRGSWPRLERWDLQEPQAWAQ